jgi:DNA-binding LytR/AlgR family response regulator
MDLFTSLLAGHCLLWNEVVKLVVDASAVDAPRILARQNRRLLAVPVRDIAWVMAEQNYVRVVCGPQNYRWRCALRYVERALTPYGFVRTHRRYLINRAAIRVIEPTEHGDFRITLADGSVLASGRSFRSFVVRLRQTLNGDLVSPVC